MKPELINLLDRLRAQGVGNGATATEQFSSLVITPNGRAMAVYRHGCVPFRNLDELETFAYTGQLPSAEPNHLCAPPRPPR